MYNHQRLDLVCNVTKAGWYPCPLHVELAIPVMMETVLKEVKSLSWSVCAKIRISYNLTIH